MASAVTLHASLDGPIGEAASLDGAQVLMGEGLRAIIAERMRQVQQHGYTIAHDAAHEPAEIAGAATCYAATAHDQLTGGKSYDPAETPAEWPWEPASWRCGDARRNLVKAAALIWAAIDRIDNAGALR